MMGTPTLNEIELAWRKSGSGVCIIVEGETELEDAWFYQQWFDYRAREVSFFPQDGYEQVTLAVEELRPRLGAKSVYGIIDRDFAPDVTSLPLPENGVFRTQKYTLENYLLNPECWFEYIRPHTRRSPKPGWNSLAEAEATILSLYQGCVPLSAYNWTLHQARAQNYEAFKVLPEADRQYKRHPKALDNMDVPDRLHQLQKQMRLTGLDLPQLFGKQVEALMEAALDTLETMVSGKFVLTLLREQFPLKVFGRQAWDDVLGAYIDKCSDPPGDLVELIEFILQDAHG